MRSIIMEFDEDIWELLTGVGRRRDMPTHEVLRKFIKLGLLADRLENDPYRSLAVYNNADDELREMSVFGDTNLDEEAPNAPS